MAALLAGDEDTPSLRGKIDLIYIDPPFDSKADYRTKIKLPGTTIDQKPTVLEQFAYSDTWADGTASYLAMITPRLVLMKELLSERGSIWVHLDWHVGHYVKLVLDEIFGKDNFRNEIAWHYSGWNKRLRTSFERRHDVIFYYSKSGQPYFASYFEKWASREEYVKKRKQKVLRDESGREYVLSDAGGGQRIKRYLDDVMAEGVVVDDVWHLDKLNNSAGESVGYATQKPVSLLSRIVQAGSPNGEQIAANKVKGARCALAWSEETAKLAREHNNAQLIGIGGRMHTEEEALAIVDAFVSQPWSDEERHQRRIDILAEYERTGIAPQP
ncbi:RpiB/LacA/LacB family sugar-phosphate isomerase [Corynebacterium variabile]|uniref:RpiB/LacA/LacB family sugar-phosphate isomerase n=1 Tax=Corynebacterium variabile TaxID=1727 RepID=UPI002FDF8FEA